METVVFAHPSGSPARLPLSPATRHSLTPRIGETSPISRRWGLHPDHWPVREADFNPGRFAHKGKHRTNPIFMPTIRTQSRFPTACEPIFAPSSHASHPARRSRPLKRPVCALNMRNEPSPKTGQCGCPRRASMPENPTAHSGKPIVPPLWHPFVFRI